MAMVEDSSQEQLGNPAGIGRRTAIGRSLSVALAGSVLGGIGLSAAVTGIGQGASSPSGIMLPQGMRRIITGHDPEGKSYIVSDDRVTMQPFPNLFHTTGDNPFGPGPESAPRELRPSDSPQLEPEVGVPTSCSSPFPRHAQMPSCFGIVPRRSTSISCWVVN